MKATSQGVGIKNRLQGHVWAGIRGEWVLGLLCVFKRRKLRGRVPWWCHWFFKKSFIEWRESRELLQIGALSLLEVNSFVCGLNLYTQRRVQISCHQQCVFCCWVFTAVRQGWASQRDGSEGLASYWAVNCSKVKFEREETFILSSCFYPVLKLSRWA